VNPLARRCGRSDGDGVGAMARRPRHSIWFPRRYCHSFRRKRRRFTRIEVFIMLLESERGSSSPVRRPFYRSVLRRSHIRLGGRSQATRPPDGTGRQCCAFESRVKRFGKAALNTPDIGTGSCASNSGFLATIWIVQCPGAAIVR